MLTKSDAWLYCFLKLCLRQRNERLESKRLRYRRRIATLLQDLQDFDTLIAASENFLDSYYNDEGLEEQFAAFESLFTRYTYPL